MVEEDKIKYNTICNIIIYESRSCAFVNLINNKPVMIITVT